MVVRVFVATAACALVASCGSDAPPASESPSPPVSTLVLGPVQLEADGVTYSPSTGRGGFFVEQPDGALLALDAKSPVLGCKVTEVDDELRAENGLGSDATLFDMCHGAEFDRTGARVDAPDCPGLRQLDGVRVLDGQVIVELGITRAPSEPSPTTTPARCGPGSAADH